MRVARRKHVPLVTRCVATLRRFRWLRILRKMGSGRQSVLYLGLRNSGDPASGPLPDVPGPIGERQLFACVQRHHRADPKYGLYELLNRAEECDAEQ